MVAATKKRHRPQLRRVPLGTVSAIINRTVPGPWCILTMSVAQWDSLLAEAYRLGFLLLELDDDEIPRAAYRKDMSTDAPSTAASPAVAHGSQDASPDASAIDTAGAASTFTHGEPMAEEGRRTPWRRSRHDDNPPYPTYHRPVTGPCQK